MFFFAIVYVVSMMNFVPDMEWSEENVYLQEPPTFARTKPPSRTAATLPEACRMLSSSTGRRRDLPKSPPQFREIVTDIQGIPPEFVYTKEIHPLEPMSFIMYKNNTVQNPKIPLSPLPKNVTLIFIPDGIVVDSSIAGPYRDGELDPINLYQSKRWFAGTEPVDKFVRRNPVIEDVPGMGVQLSAWTGFTWNHFAGDTLVRLGLVYDALMSDEPPWRDAKIIVSTDLDKYYGDILFSQPIVGWIYDKLNLTHRIVPNNGWIVKANHTTRFEYLVMPDVAPHPKCGGNPFVVDPVFPRGTLLPIQRALGSTESTPKKWVVYASRKDAGGRRAVQVERRELILRFIQEMLSDIKSPLEVLEWTYDNPDATFQVFRHAAVVVGPHGANLWNAAFAPPGGLLIEFNTVKGEFLDADCRTYAFSLASAASLSYALVETQGFGYENENLMPEVEDVVGIIKSFLLGETV
jgi:hypothetical protein